MANDFNELLLQTLKEVGIRLERLEGRIDHVINEKADKTDVKEVKSDVKSIIEKLDQKADKTDVKEVKSDVKSIIEKLDQKVDKTDLDATNGKVETLDGKVETLDGKVETP